MASQPPAPRVLVVDDSPTAVRILAHLLREEGYEVASAGDGEEALLRIRERPPALVIVDSQMPRTDGYELCRRVRADPALEPQPYLLMLTSGGRDLDRLLAEEAGADEFMTKPFSPSRLRSRLREILGE